MENYICKICFRIWKIWEKCIFLRGPRPKVYQPR